MKLLDKVMENRDALRRIVKRHHGDNPRLFGSVARGEDHEGSDVDLLIEATDSLTLFDIARMRDELTAAIGRPVEVLTIEDLGETMRGPVLERSLRL